jgi:hypothetical protein
MLKLQVSTIISRQTTGEFNTGWIRRLLVLLITAAAVTGPESPASDFAGNNSPARQASVTIPDLRGSEARGGAQPVPVVTVVPSQTSANPPPTKLSLDLARIRKICIPSGDGRIPSIPWVKHSDWIDAKTDVRPAARGDGIADDTAAIQTALNRIGKAPGDPKVVYLPPGNYRITQTLSLTKRNGGMLIGDGRDTRLVWDGRPGGRMFWSNGAARQSYIGLVWDGAGKAAVGIDHDSKTLYETRVMHEYMEFRGFTVAGIRVGHDQKLASAEMLFSNLKFENNANGVLLQDWNDYNNVFDGCYFINNGYGIRAEKGNVVVRNSRFESSGKSDLFLSTHSHSIRRVVSTGSYSFIRTLRGPIANGLIRIQDSRIDGWRNPDGAIITELRGPLTIFDVTFSRPPGNRAPIRLDNPRYMNQIAILSDVSSDATASVIDKGPNGVVYNLPSARRDGAHIAANQMFLRNSFAPPEKILDVKQDCGARGDGAMNDTLAIQRCFDAAQTTKEAPTVYFPSGTYRISKTLEVRPGARYQIDGTGWHSRIVWSGPGSGTVLHIQDPDGLVVEHLTLGGPVGTTALLQTGTTASSVRYHNVFGYYDDETRDERIVFDGLPRGTVVVADHLDGRVTVRNSSEAVILLGFLASVQMVVEGATPQDGFLGVLSRVSALEQFPLVIRDNQSLTMTDWYNEQTQHLVSLKGGGDAVGRVILDHTQAETDDKIFAEVDGFHGLLAEVGGMFGRAADDDERVISVQRTRDFDVLLLGNTYWNKPPDIRSSSGHSFLLGNSLSKKHWGPNAVVENVTDKRDEADVAAVLDAFRELGAYDLALNYCQTSQ